MSIYIHIQKMFHTHLCDSSPKKQEQDRCPLPLSIVSDFFFKKLSQRISPSLFTLLDTHTTTQSLQFCSIYNFLPGFWVLIFRSSLSFRILFPQGLQGFWPHSLLRFFPRFFSNVNVCCVFVCVCIMHKNPSANALLRYTGTRKTRYCYDLPGS